MVMKMKRYLSIAALLVILSSGVSLAQRLTVGVSTANIRSGPGKNYDVLWQVEKYHPIEVIEKSGNWYLFKDFEGDKGWIYYSLVRSIPSVITKKENCNIRSGAGTKFEILFAVEKGIPFKIVEEKGSWLHVRHADGDKGWIHKSLVW
jgi:SH3-like domain-containing protein